MKWRVAAGILFMAAMMTLVTPFAAAPITVGMGVVFQPSGSWANITFASSQSFSSIALVSNAVSFDSTAFGVEKLPASLPRVENNISLWSPSAGMGSVALEWNGTADSGSNVWWNLSGLVGNGFYRILVDDSPFVHLLPADGAGAIGFNYSAWSSTHKFTVQRLTSGAPQNVGVAWCIPGPCPLAVVTVTGSPINLTRESAILRGNLVSMGDNSEVNVSFEWGINESLGFTTEIQLQDATGQFEQLILGLVPDSMYYFRARAVGSEGTVYGAILSFRTEAVATIFDSLLPVGLAIAGFFVIIGLYAMSRRGGHTMGQLLVFIGGLALVFVGFDYQLSIGDVQISLMIIAAGFGVVALSSVDMVQSYRR